MHTIIIGLLFLLVPGSGVLATVLESQCWTSTYIDEFDDLKLRDESTGEGQYDTRYIWDRETRINEELQYYIDPRLHQGVSPFSTSNGQLSITAAKTPAQLSGAVDAADYVSGVLTSRNGYSQQYGRFEVRAKMPAGRGLWPAFWLLPTFKQWPQGIAVLPEIDVMEFLGHEPNTYHTTVHSNQTGKLESFPSDQNGLPDLTTDFHTYTVVWTEKTIEWFFDGRRVKQHRTPDDLHVPMHFLLNLAVGGKWAGAPDRQTQFPASFLIDYVKIYKRCN